MVGIGCQDCVINFSGIQMSNFLFEDIRHTEKLYSISYFCLREVGGGSIGGVEEQA